MRVAACPTGASAAARVLRASASVRRASRTPAGAAMASAYAAAPARVVPAVIVGGGRVGAALERMGDGADIVRARPRPPPGALPRVLACHKPRRHCLRRADAEPPRAAPRRSLCAAASLFLPRSI
jgi:hypothetical protein